MWIHFQFGIITGFICTGTRICGDCAGSIPAKSAADIPMMVMGKSFIRIFFPITFGSFAKRLI